MKRIQIMILAVTCMVMTLSVQSWAETFESNPLLGAYAIIPVQAGTTAGAVPSPGTSSGLEPSGTTSGVVPNFQAPAPSFGAEPIGGTGLNAPRNGAIFPQIPMNKSSESTPRPLAPQTMK